MIKSNAAACQSERSSLEEDFARGFVRIEGDDLVLSSW